MQTYIKILLSPSQLVAYFLSFFFFFHFLYSLLFDFPFYAFTHTYVHKYVENKRIVYIIKDVYVNQHDFFGDTHSSTHSYCCYC